PQPVACYTHWNYQCGTQVTLYTDSPFAPGCSPCPPIDAPQNYVLFRAIGNIPLSRIYGTGIDSGPNATLPRPTTAANVGLVADYPGAGQDAPFGGLLLPRIEFDSSLLESNLAAYYQVSIRPGTSGGWTILKDEIDRHYNYFAGTNLITAVYNLGPQTVGAVPNLFAIPPALPPQGDWAFPNPVYDLANAQFPTTALPSPPTPGG